ncbi:MAG: hypothetical protein ABI477_14370 [Chryseolinea sp.]
MVLIEVFKTSVIEPVHAAVIISTIRQVQSCYHVNFDLDDCDHIRRVKTNHNIIDAKLLLQILPGLGFEACILSDQTYLNNSNLSRHKQLL